MKENIKSVSEMAFIDIAEEQRNRERTMEEQEYGYVTAAYLQKQYSTLSKLNAELGIKNINKKKHERKN